MPKIQLSDTISVKDFAKRLSKSVSDTIKILMDNGFLATINEELDFDTAAIIAEDLGFEVEKEKKEKKRTADTGQFELVEILKKLKKSSGKNLKIRPPVVTILGHVDHGKTTLLDTIRRTKVAEHESGGITQHITAYQVPIKKKIITFVDTPGHEAFHRMRARGAGIADIAIIIIAADDGVKPQTKEVLENVNGHLPFIVCLNKIDKSEANPDRVKGQLAEENVLVEGWGGNVPIVAISAKQNKNIDDLLETILLVADIENFKADFMAPGIGLVLESHLDKLRGPVATVIIKNGTLKKGDLIVAGRSSGRVRLLEDFQGKEIAAATPSMPVTILGFKRMPSAGRVIKVITGDKSFLKRKKRVTGKEKSVGRTSALKRIEQSLETEKYKKLNIVIKADTKGSLEAIEQIMNNLTVEDVVVKIIRSGVGQINESDVLMSKVSNALLYGFRISASVTAKEMSDKENVKPRFFDVIYHLIEDVRQEMAKIVTVQEMRVDHGTLKVLAIFRTGKNDMIVGGRVTEGKLFKGDGLEIEREGEIIGNGKLVQLKKGKDNVGESSEGEECGINFEAVGPLPKIQVGDKIHSYVITEKTIGEDRLNVSGA